MTRSVSGEFSFREIIFSDICRVFGPLRRHHVSANCRIRGNVIFGELSNPQELLESKNIHVIFFSVNCRIRRIVFSVNWRGTHKLLCNIFHVYFDPTELNVENIKIVKCYNKNDQLFVEYCFSYKLYITHNHYFIESFISNFIFIYNNNKICKFFNVNGI